MRPASIEITSINFILIFSTLHFTNRQLQSNHLSSASPSLCVEPQNPSPFLQKQSSHSHIHHPTIGQASPFIYPRHGLICVPNRFGLSNFVARQRHEPLCNQLDYKMAAPQDAATHMLLPPRRGQIKIKMVCATADFVVSIIGMIIRLRGTSTITSEPTIV
ncbi:unnamed protein product [Rhodiola kirilowii]